MNILLIGSGGREHTIALTLAKSPKLTQLFIAPGNAGTAQVGTNIPIKDSELEKLLEENKYMFHKSYSRLGAIKTDNIIRVYITFENKINKYDFYLISYIIINFSSRKKLKLYCIIIIIYPIIMTQPLQILIKRLQKPNKLIFFTE